VQWNADYVMGSEQMDNLVFDEETMFLLNSRKVVLFDSETLLPILTWEALRCPEVCVPLRSHFEPLAQMPENRPFNLARTRDGFRNEAPHREQRMQMVGSRICNYNLLAKQRPTAKRPGLIANVVNTDADANICLYADTWAEFDCKRVKAQTREANTHQQPLLSVCLSVADWYNPVMMKMYEDMASAISSSSPRVACYTATLQRCPCDQNTERALAAVLIVQLDSHHRSFVDTERCAFTVCGWPSIP
jgi:hypothetical protein